MGNKNVTCKINIFRPKVKQLTESMTKTLVNTAKEVHTDLVQSQTMPFQQGNLQNESTFVDVGRASSGNVSIVSSTPYARRLYFHPEYNFNKSQNPNAGGRWFDAYLPGGKKENFAQDVFNKFYKEESGV